MKASWAEIAFCAVCVLVVGGLCAGVHYETTRPAPTDGHGVPEVIEEPAPVVEPVPEPAKLDPEPVAEPAPVPAPAPPKPVVAPAAPTSLPGVCGPGGCPPSAVQRDLPQPSARQQSAPRRWLFWRWRRG